MPERAPRGAAGALAAVLLAVAAVGCGSERKLSAEEFAEDVNAQGVGFELGERLISADEDKQVYAVELEAVAKLPGSNGGHTGGSLAVHEDTEEAETGMRACQSSADLLCYRAANVVVVLESGGIEAQRLGVAIENLAKE
jgi:hypothetical protein